MKKITATIAATLLLSLGALVSPAYADEAPTDASTLCAINIDGTDLEHTLTNQVAELRVNLGVTESHIEFLAAQRDLEVRRGDALQRKVDHKQQVIDRLRAELRKS